MTDGAAASAPGGAAPDMPDMPDVPGAAERSRWAAELAFAIETARAAGAILMDHYERLERIDHKSPTDVVTEADHLSEELVIAAIRRQFAGDAILAEESGAHAASAVLGDGDGPPPGRVGAARTWVIDPLDGTVNYANGLPVFCVSIGFVEDGQPVAGVVLDPTRNELFAATADGPATLNGRPIRSSGKDKLTDCVVSLALSGRSVSSRVRSISKEIRVWRSMGSAALALAYVGNGRFDAFIQESSLSAWDIAAAGLVAQRAGATVTDLRGGPWYAPETVTRTVGLIAAPAPFQSRFLDLANRR